MKRRSDVNQFTLQGSDFKLKYVIFSLTVFSDKAKHLKMRKIFFDNYFMSNQIDHKGKTRDWNVN